MTRQYTISFDPVVMDKIYPAASAVLGFINQGNTTVIFNGSFKLFPGAALSPTEGLPGEQDMSTYTIKFDDTGVASPVNNLIIIRKTYIN